MLAGSCGTRLTKACCFMANPKRIRALLEMADEDLAGAKILLGSSIRLARYHVQQGAEKAVKALLEFRGVNPGREHRFEILSEMLPKDDPWRARVQSLSRLSPAATSLRYPTAEGRVLPPPARSAVDAELDLAAKLVADVRKAVGVPAPAAVDGQERARKDAVAKQIVAIAKSRKLDVPSNVEEKLVIYADEKDLLGMLNDVKTATSFREMLDARSIVLPAYDDD